MAISATIVKLLKGSVADHNIDLSLLYSMCFEDIPREGSGNHEKFLDRFSSCGIKSQAISPHMLMEIPWLTALLRRAREFEEKSASPVHCIDGNVLKRLTYDEIMEPIEQLPDGLRVIFNHYFFYKGTHEKTAGLLGISLNVTQKLFEKSKAAFRQTLLTEKFTKSTDEEIRAILKEKVSDFPAVIKLMRKYDRKDIRNEL